MIPFSINFRRGENLRRNLAVDAVAILFRVTINWFHLRRRIHVSRAEASRRSCLRLHSQARVATHTCSSAEPENPRFADEFLVLHCLACRSRTVTWDDDRSCVDTFRVPSSPGICRIHPSLGRSSVYPLLPLISPGLCEVDFPIPIPASTFHRPLTATGLS